MWWVKILLCSKDCDGSYIIQPRGAARWVVPPVLAGKQGHLYMYCEQ